MSQLGLFPETETDTDPQIGRSDLYARQFDPGFCQSALRAHPLHRATFGDGWRDWVGDLFGLFAGAMGTEEQMVGAARLSSFPMHGIVRALLLNPQVQAHAVPLELFLPLSHATVANHRVPYFCVNLADDLVSAQRVIRGLGRSGQFENVRVHALRERGVVVGANARQVWKAAAELGRPVPPGHLPGIAAFEAAAHLHADYLAFAEAWVDSGTSAPMPRSPALQVFRQDSVLDTPAGDGELGLMIVGVGALGQAFLEGCLVDPRACRALQGGTVTLIDPDSIEGSNLSRQSMLEGPHQLHRAKCLVVAETFTRLWANAPNPPRLVCRQERFAREHVEQHRPTVLGLFTDNLASRSQAYEAMRERDGLAIMAGTEFTVGQVRAVDTGARRVGRDGLPPACLNCGCEQLADAAADEEVERSQRHSCQAEVTPSNVLTNWLVSLWAVKAMLRYLRQGEVEPFQRHINWLLAERATHGATLPACECGESMPRGSHDGP
jgi:hypothetical protein